MTDHCPCGKPLVAQQTKYCSRPCYTEAQRGSDPFTPESRRARTPWNRGIKSGIQSPRRSRVTLSCLECNTEFEVKAYRAQVAKFCSTDCHYKNADRGLSTENQKIRKSADYRRWREQVFTRDDWTCQECGVRGGVELNADHVKPFALFPESRFDIENGRTLCRPCHLATPTFGRQSIYRPRAVAQEA